MTREREPGNHHGFLTEFKEFVDSISEDRQPWCSGYDGRASTEGAMAVIKSHETGPAGQTAADLTLVLHSARPVENVTPC